MEVPFWKGRQIGKMVTYGGEFDLELFYRWESNGFANKICQTSGSVLVARVMPVLRRAETKERENRHKEFWPILNWPFIKDFPELYLNMTISGIKFTYPFL